MDSSRNLRAIEGLRVLVSLWVVILHTWGAVLVFSYSVDPSYSRNFKFAWWSGTVRGFGIQVDIFFMISGFLLTYQLYNESKRLKLLRYFDKAMLVFIAAAKKLVRLVMIPLFVAVFLFYLNDMGTDSLFTLFKDVLLLKSSEETSPINFVVMWSNKVEFISSIVIVVIFQFIQRNNRFGKQIALLLIFVTVAITVITMRENSHFTVSTFAKYSHPLLPLYISPGRMQWLRTEYNIPTLPEPYAVDIRTEFSKVFYLPWWNRLGPFFIGQYMAYCYIGERQHETQHGKHGVYSGFVHLVSLSLSIITLLLPTILGLVIIKATKNSVEDIADPSFNPAQYPRSASASDLKFADYFFSGGLFRFVFATAFAYLLYRMLLPTSHPLHLTTIARFLSADVFQQLGVLTYGVYMIHFRVIFELIFRLLPFPYLNQLLHLQGVGIVHVLIYGILGFSISAVFSGILHYSYEKTAIGVCHAALNTFKSEYLSARQASNISTNNNNKINTTAVATTEHIVGGGDAKKDN